MWGSRKSVILDQETLSFVPGWSNTPKPSSMPSALAVFTCRPNSHPFQERHVYLDEPVKIGRSVARCRPAQNNATFDCKVLSRNHALVWFDHKTGKVGHPPVNYGLEIYVNRFTKQWRMFWNMNWSKTCSIAVHFDSIYAMLCIVIRWCGANQLNEALKSKFTTIGGKTWWLLLPLICCSEMLTYSNELCVVSCILARGYIREMHCGCLR